MAASAPILNLLLTTLTCYLNKAAILQYGGHARYLNILLF